MFYVTIRSLGGGTPGWLHLCLSRALSRRMPSVLSIAVTVLLGGVALDEVVYVALIRPLLFREVVAPHERAMLITLTRFFKRRGCKNTRTNPIAGMPLLSRRWTTVETSYQPRAAKVHRRRRT